MSAWVALGILGSTLCLFVAPNVIAIAAHHVLTKRPRYRLTATLSAVTAAAALLTLAVVLGPDLSIAPYSGLAWMGSLAAISIAVGVAIGSLRIGINWRRVLTSVAIAVLTVVYVFIGLAASMTV